jgi:hypothetical protein
LSSNIFEMAPDSSLSTSIRQYPSLWNKPPSS